MSRDQQTMTGISNDDDRNDVNDRGDDVGEIRSQPHRHREIDGYAVELVEEVAAVLGCRVDFHVVEERPLQHGRTPTVSRPGGWPHRGVGSAGHRPHRVHVSTAAAEDVIGKWTGLVDELTGGVIVLYSIIGNRRQQD